LAPDVEEESLVLPVTNDGHDPIKETDLRPIAKVFDWKKTFHPNAPTPQRYRLLRPQMQWVLLPEYRQPRVPEAQNTGSKEQTDTADRNTYETKRANSEAYDSSGGHPDRKDAFRANAYCQNPCRGCLLK